MIDSVHVMGELRGGEVVVQEHSDVVEIQRRANFPIVPIVVLDSDAFVVIISIHPIARRCAARHP